MFFFIGFPVSLEAHWICVPIYAGGQNNQATRIFTAYSEINIPVNIKVNYTFLRINKITKCKCVKWQLICSLGIYTFKICFAITLFGTIIKIVYLI